MTAFSPLGAFVPGSGPLHRLRPGAKLLGLFAFACLAVATGGVPWTLALLAVGAAAAILAGLRGPALWRTTRGFMFIALPLFAFQAWQHGWERGVTSVGDLLALILAASAVTASTAVDDMLDTVTWALRPLRPIGVDPDRVALAFSLVIRAIPSVLGIARETAEAARARGLEREVRARLVPMVVRSVSHAQLTGQALAARGIGDE